MKGKEGVVTFHGGKRERWIFSQWLFYWVTFFNRKKGTVTFFIEKKERWLFSSKKRGHKDISGADFEDAGGNINPLMRSILVRYHYHYLPIRHWTRKKDVLPLSLTPEKVFVPLTEALIFSDKKVLAPFFGIVKMSLGLWKPIRTILIRMISRRVPLAISLVLEPCVRAPKGRLEGPKRGWKEQGLFTEKKNRYIRS